MNTASLRTIRFVVPIPNLGGDGIAETIPVEVQARLDPETGEEVLTPESLDLVEKTQARHMGLMSPDDIKTLRERLDLTQEEMSDLLQIGEKSYTRWESGRSRPSRSLNVLLCALRDGQIDVNYLRALRHPASLTQWRATSRCNYLWDFLAPWTKPESRGVVTDLSEESRAWFRSALGEFEPRLPRSQLPFYGHSPGKTAWRAAMLKALASPSTTSGLRKPEWPSSWDGGFDSLGPDHEIADHESSSS